MPSAQVDWNPPGPGQWLLQRSHTSGGTTPIVKELFYASMPSGNREVFAEFGVPADTFAVAFLNGFLYTRLRPLLRADRQVRRRPPLLLLKLVVRLHPEFRRRAARATAVEVEQPWRDVIERWRTIERPARVAANAALQRVDPSSLDEAALVAHIEALLDLSHESWHRHFVLHGHDLGPIGVLVHDAHGWGLDPVEVLGMLRGASPSTTEPADALRRLRAIVSSSGARPDSLEELRSLSGDAAAELDRYLELRGQHLVTRYDLDGRRVIELPSVVLGAVSRSDDTPSGAAPDAAAARLRAAVPVADRARFDDELAQARLAMDLRDDNGPITVEWPLGLLRRALLEAGERLVARGRIERAEHAVGLHSHEIGPLMLDGTGPSAVVLADREQRRVAERRLRPPSSVGTPEPAPPPGILPAPTQRFLEVLNDIVALLEAASGGDVLAGTGIGTRTYRGRVRRAESPDAAVESLEPGEVLVVAFTTPAYNAVLPLAGALVTSEGGPMSHAAVLARELGIAAVVGASGALDGLSDGNIVDVDPVKGEVRLVDVTG